MICVGRRGGFGCGGGGGGRRSGGGGGCTSGGGGGGDNRGGGGGLACRLGGGDIGRRPVLLSKGSGPDPGVTHSAMSVWLHFVEVEVSFMMISSGSTEMAEQPPRGPPPPPKAHTCHGLAEAPKLNIARLICGRGRKQSGEKWANVARGAGGAGARMSYGSCWGTAST